MSDSLKQTVLYDWHKTHGAKMGNFGGYEMPLWYDAGPKNEHLAVISAAGVFDTSHMAVLTVRGSGAFGLLQYCFTKDLTACIGPAKNPLVPGRCAYGAFLNQAGGVLDDALVYMNDDEAYTIVVNAGMGAEISTHLKAQAGTASVDVTDLTDRLGKIDVQGPQAAKLLSGLIQDPDAVFETMPYFSFKGDVFGEQTAVGEVKLRDGIPVLLSRTGYTGEFGFEIFLAATVAIQLWERLLDAGGRHQALPCGLAARDSLRAGAVLPLSHQDIGDWPFVNHPWPFALPWNDSGTGFTKAFLGDESLLNADRAFHTHAFVGFDPRKVARGDDVVVMDDSGNAVGTVLTCATDMAIDRFEGRVYSIASRDRPDEMKFRGLCCGFVKTDRKMNPGETVYLQAGKRKLRVEITRDVRPARTARRAIAKML